jgi:hypothetical protein
MGRAFSISMSIRGIVQIASPSVPITELKYRKYYRGQSNNISDYELIAPSGTAACQQMTVVVEHLMEKGMVTN